MGRAARSPRPRGHTRDLSLRALARAIALLGLVALGATSCNAPCKSSTACEPGESCELVSGDCIPGCKSNDDCATTARCDTPTGICRPTVVLPGSSATDAGTATATVSDAGTATVADGG